jgi:hypothetical protein
LVTVRSWPAVRLWRQMGTAVGVTNGHGCRRHQRLARRMSPPCGRRRQGRDVHSEAAGGGPPPLDSPWTAGSSTALTVLLGFLEDDALHRPHLRQRAPALSSHVCPAPPPPPPPAPPAAVAVLAPTSCGWLGLRPWPRPPPTRATSPGSKPRPTPPPPPPPPTHMPPLSALRAHQDSGQGPLKQVGALLLTRKVALQMLE